MSSADAGGDEEVVLLVVASTVGETDLDEDKDVLGAIEVDVVDPPVDEGSRMMFAFMTVLEGC
jgi:hypothetical protein